MANATAFPDPWGYEKIIGGNETDIAGAAIDVWKESAASSIAMGFTFGFIPILIVTLIYVRTKRIDASMLGGLITTFGIKSFGLMTASSSNIMLIIFGLGLGLSLAYKLTNKT